MYLVGSCRLFFMLIKRFKSCFEEDLKIVSSKIISSTEAKAVSFDVDGGGP